MKLNEQIEKNKKTLDKITTDDVINQLEKNEMFEEDKIYKVEKNEELGGVPSMMVRSMNNLLVMILLKHKLLKHS